MWHKDLETAFTSFLKNVRSKVLCLYLDTVLIIAKDQDHDNFEMEHGS